MKYKNILITGGAGFIGANLALKLVHRGYTVTVIDNLSKQIHGNTPKQSSLYLSIKNKVNFIYGDICKKSDCEKAINNQDCIIHCAAETGTGQSMSKIKKYSDVNIGGTSNILEVLINKKHTIKKMVLASSRAVYGEGKYFCSDCSTVYPNSRKEKDMREKLFDIKCPNCFKTIEAVSTDEHSKINPISMYGITKYTQEQLFSLAGNIISIPTVILRYQNVYGPGQSLLNPYTGIISIFSTQLLKNTSINIFEDGTEKRDFIFIDDATNATITTMEKDAANNEVFNVGSGKATTVLYVANLLKNELKSNSDIIVTGDYRIGDIRHNYADISKIQKILNFKIKVMLEEGITKFTHWVTSPSIFTIIQE